MSASYLKSEIFELNLSFLDALCRWAEAVVDLKTAELYAASEQVDFDAMRAETTRAERSLHALMTAARRAGARLPFDALCETYGLSNDEVRILRLALAPAIESSFRKRVARYRDNVLLDFVDVDFLLSMLYDQRVERLKARDLLLPTSRLVGERLVTTTLPRDASLDSLLAYEVRIPERLVTFLMGQTYLERTVATFCDLSTPDVAQDAVVMDDKVRGEVLSLVRGWTARQRRGPALGPSCLVLALFGPPGTGKNLFASSLATELGAQMVTADSAKLAVDEAGFRNTLESIFSEAKMRGAVLAFDHCEALFSQKNPRIPSLYGWFERHHGVVLLLSNDAKALDPSLERYVAYQVDFSAPDVYDREKLWRSHLATGGIPPDDQVDIPAMANTFEFSGAQIRNAVSVARELAESRGATAVTQEDLTTGSWAQVRQDMEEYSRKSMVRLTLDDLILPEEELKQVRDVLDAALHKTFIMTRWGFGKRLSTGKGLCCLFTGEPGTGKTLCAEILAVQLGQNLYQISIPRVMSKYIGETEKNIERIFHIAKANNSILLFDEADALFTSRVKVETSVDRFSNMEINLLLQEIERFDGLVILTTNLEKNMDKAFERRIQFKVRFPFPEKEYRARIWKAHIPRECPIDPTIDWDLVGRSFELSGGNIKNAVLRSAYKAAKDKSQITIRHIVAAAEAECRHAGKLFRGLKLDDLMFGPDEEEGAQS